MVARLPWRRAPANFVCRMIMESRSWSGEPKVQNPIAMAWDEKGRMWVAENYTYGSRKIRFDLSLRDRVIVLADEDGDGVAEFRKVFTDEVQMLTSVEVGMGGVWLMCPPRLLFIPDRNGDLIPDGEPQVMLDGFDVLARGNYHNFANGLRWGPDGWLYGRCGHSAPANWERRVLPMISEFPLMGEFGAIIPRMVKSRCWPMERSTHGATTGMSMVNSFS